MQMKKMKLVWGLMGLLLLLVACGRNETRPENGALNEAVTPTAVPVTIATETEATAIEETAVNPIVSAFNQPAQVAGDIIILSGTVMDANGSSIADAVVEIWQTDNNGVYDHPNDPGTNGRERSFQFYGTSTTDADGRYSFRTLKPAAYGSRPPHIHVKVKLNGTTLLTTQFYFTEDQDIVENEGLFQQAGDLGHLLLVLLTESTDTHGNPIRVGSNNLVVNTSNSNGTLTLTPSQGEGPYYPVVTVADFDNDLTILP